MHGLHQFFDADGRLLDSVAKPGYRFDPRTRPWYKAVGEGAAAIMTAPYPFFTTQEIGATMARRTADGKAVVGLDVTMGTIAEALKDLRITPSTELAVIDSGQQVIGYHDAGRMIAPAADGGLRLARIDELGSPVLAQAASALGRRRGARRTEDRRTRLADPARHDSGACRPITSPCSSRFPTTSCSPPRVRSSAARSSSAWSSCCWRSASAGGAPSG